MAGALRGCLRLVPSNTVVELGMEAEALPSLPTPVKLLPRMQADVLGDGGLLTKAISPGGKAENTGFYGLWWHISFN